MGKILILLFNIPRNKPSFRVKIWRALKKAGAKQLLRSDWHLPYSKEGLSKLKKIAKDIRKAKGNAEIIIGKKYDIYA